jgi:hypothetical protein
VADKMNTLELLKQKNPELEFYSVNSPEFARYGSVVKFDMSCLIDEAEKLEFPSDGSKYEPSVASFEAVPIRNAIKDELFGELNIQIGNCWGYNSYLNALEWHKSSEINIAATDLVLLLAKLDDIKDGRLDSAKVKAFYVARGEAVEVYADTLHFCPCQVSDSGFNCVVILPEGTNTNLDSKPKDNLLFRKNKWIFCHENNEALKARGVVPGIYGENYRIKY